MHRSLAMFRMIDARLNVALHGLRKHFPDQRMDAITIDRMQDAKPFLQRRNSVSGIETENHERFGRPIIKYLVRPERPTSHMSEPFSLPQIKFASFQLARLLCNPLLSALAVLDVDTRSKPLDYVPLF